MAIVTGAAKGIGNAVVRRLLRDGVRCALWDIDDARLQSATRDLDAGDAVVGVKVDITSESEVAGALTQTKEALGPVNIMVNNAGIAGVSKKLWECSVEEWRQVIELDLMAVFLCCRAVVPQMLEQGWGRIVNIASIAGKEGNPNASHYSAAKSGVLGLSKSLGKELAQTGVLVNAVTPAVIETEILKQVSQEHIDYMVSKIPMGRVGQTHEVAELVAWLCSERCSFSTGAVFDISGGRATY